MQRSRPSSFAMRSCLIFFLVFAGLATPCPRLLPRARCPCPLTAAYYIKHVRSPRPLPPPPTPASPRPPPQVRIVDAVANAAEAASVLNRELCHDSPLSPAPMSPARGSTGNGMGSFSRVGSSSFKALPRPAFGSSPSLSGLGEDDQVSESNVTVPCYEITIASKDQVTTRRSPLRPPASQFSTFLRTPFAPSRLSVPPSSATCLITPQPTPAPALVHCSQAKLLSRLSNALGDLGLNIREAHAFNTKDGFSLDVFVVDGWSLEALEGLEDALADKFGALFATEPQQSVQVQQPPAWLQEQQEAFEQERQRQALAGAMSAIAGPGTAGAEDDWELNPEQLKLTSIIGSGSFGDLYRGYFAGSDVAVKILKDVHENQQQFQEFLQEVAIMRKVRHKNVVQFIGACTRPPNLCIVFEFMSGGSVFDYMRRHGPLSVDQVVRVGVEVARGMDYLHQMRIIHRDLKAANLLMDEHGTVKIADFGVARVVTQGIMTAETGTYRWMAPEVIEHRPYSHKVTQRCCQAAPRAPATCRVHRTLRAAASRPTRVLRLCWLLEFPPPPVIEGGMHPLAPLVARFLIPLLIPLSPAARPSPQPPAAPPSRPFKPRSPLIRACRPTPSLSASSCGSSSPARSPTAISPRCRLRWASSRRACAPPSPRAFPSPSPRSSAPAGAPSPSSGPNSPRSPSSCSTCG